MDIRALKYYVELVRTKNFTRASERCFVSQPTISKIIRNLEIELDQKLINKKGRQISLTHAGMILYERAEKILIEMQQLESELHDLKCLKQGHLSIGIPPMVGHLYADTIARYQQRYPEIELSIVEYGGRRIEQAIMQGEIDLGITMLPVKNEELFITQQFMSYPMMAVLPQHPRWQQADQVSLTELHDQIFYLFSSEFVLSELIKARCDELGFIPKIGARSSQWDFLAAMVQKGQGVAFLPSPICDQLNQSELLIKALKHPLLWNLGAVWVKDQYLPHSAEAFLALCEEDFSQAI